MIDHASLNIHVGLFGFRFFKVGKQLEMYVIENKKPFANCCSANGLELIAVIRRRFERLTRSLEGYLYEGLKVNISNRVQQ